MAVNRNRVFIIYALRLVFRAAMFALIVYFYLFRRETLAGFGGFRLLSPFSWLHLLWGVLLAGILLHLLPQAKGIASSHSFAGNYQPPAAPYRQEALAAYVKRMNRRALGVMLAWLLMNAAFGALYFSRVIGSAELILLTFFYYVSDLICMLLFCPFQRFAVKNRCCLNCRIFDWGPFFNYTPLLFIGGFFGWSLFIAAGLVLLRWETVYARHSQRFWHGSNDALSCGRCESRLCRIKKPFGSGEGGA